MRVWTNTESNGAIHAMGNGEMVVYGQGANLTNIYGPPYSAPNTLSLTTEGSEQLQDTAVREMGTSIWNHKTSVAGQPAVDYTEFVASDMAAYIRLFDCKSEGVRWVLHPHPAAKFTQCALVPGVWQQIIKAGQNAYNYPTNLWSFHRIVPQGSCKTELSPNGDLVISILPGKGSLAVVGASTYPDAVTETEKLMKLGAAAYLEPTHAHWKAFTERRLAAKPELKKLPADMAEVVDSIATLIKSQQSNDGGVMAGHYYALAYVRDQYGTAKGMLSIGMVEEARKNLEFRLRKYLLFGTLQTAETMGVDCARHIHENDESEGPGYTILQARDYIELTGDHAFGQKMWPMLDWCWTVQTKHLAGGLLPFNGDETYVAGGFFPRSGLNQGSADSTLVFIEAGKWLGKWAVDHGYWSNGFAKDQMAMVKQASEAYRKHFFAGNLIWANEPERLDHITPPRFRHGVCEGSCGWFGWTERSDKGRYLCPNCIGVKDVPAEVPAKMEVNSVSLLPAYLESDILSNEETQRVLEHVLSQADAQGHISSVPGKPACVGYDPGLILISLTKLHSPKAKQACERMLKLLDDTGAWVEYYGGGDARIGCCRARPWESGINVKALVNYLSQTK